MSGTTPELAAATTAMHEAIAAAAAAAAAADPTLDPAGRFAYRIELHRRDGPCEVWEFRSD